MKKKILIIGAGISGIVSALQLIKHDYVKYDVTIVDYLSKEGQGTSKGAVAVSLFNSINVDNAWDIIKKTKLDISNFFNLRFYKFLFKTLLFNIYSKNEKSDMNHNRLELINLINDLRFKGLKKYCKKTACIYILKTELLYKKVKKKYSYRKDDYTFLTKSEFIEKSIEPYLNNDEFYGACISHNDGWFYSEDFLKESRMICENNGYKFKFNTKVISIEENKKKIKGINVTFQTDKINYCEKYDLVINCCGAESNKLSPSIESSTYNAKGYSITFDIESNSNENIKNGIIIRPDNRYLRPMINNNCRVGGHMILTPYVNYKNIIDQKEKNMIIDDFRSINNITKNIKQDLDLWEGFRPITYNQKPIVEIHGSIIINTGYGGNGFVWCWSSGRKVVDYVRDYYKNI